MNMQNQPYNERGAGNQNVFKGLFNMQIPDSSLNQRMKDNGFIKREPKRNMSNIAHLNRGQSPDRTATPKINFRNPEGKIKLRDKRLIKMKLDKKKASDKSLINQQDVSPTLQQRKNQITPSKKASENMDTSGRFFAARNKDNRVKSPFQANRRIQSRMKGNIGNGRNQNATIDPTATNMRSQSPTMFNPQTLKIYVNQFNYNQDFTTIQQFQGPIDDRYQKEMLDGSLFAAQNQGFMSPQMKQRNMHDFYPPGGSRVASPVNEHRKLNKKGNKNNTFVCNPAKNEEPEMNRKQVKFSTSKIFKKDGIMNLKAKVIPKAKQEPKYLEFFEECVPDSSKLLLALEDNSDFENYLDQNEPELLEMKRRKSRNDDYGLENDAKTTK